VKFSLQETRILFLNEGREQYSAKYGCEDADNDGLDLVLTRTLGSLSYSKANWSNSHSISVPLITSFNEISRVDHEHNSHGQ
jgi:hypothetical protein